MRPQRAPLALLQVSDVTLACGVEAALASVKSFDRKGNALRTPLLAAPGGPARRAMRVQFKSRRIQAMTAGACPGTCISLSTSTRALRQNPQGHVRAPPAPEIGGHC